MSSLIGWGHTQNDPCRLYFKVFSVIIEKLCLFSAITCGYEWKRNCWLVSVVFFSFHFSHYLKKLDVYHLFGCKCVLCAFSFNHYHSSANICIHLMYFGIRFAKSTGKYFIKNKIPNKFCFSKKSFCHNVTILHTSAFSFYRASLIMRHVQSTCFSCS